MTADGTSDPGDPTTYSDAMSRENGEQWRDATGKEIMNFLSRHAWKKVELAMVKRMGRKPVPTKTVFKSKDEQDGTIGLKVRIVSKGETRRVSERTFGDFEAPWSDDCDDDQMRKATREMKQVSLWPVVLLTKEEFSNNLD